MVAKGHGRSGRPWRRINAHWRALRQPCWICGHSIDYELPARHPLSFSVDHVIPRSHGGPPTIANTRPAHYSCNAARGNRTDYAPAVRHSRQW
jgi:5-methylcytosine-specific restriction endonuclease McrA